jgi:hypothetical protein
MQAQTLVKHKFMVSRPLGDDLMDKDTGNVVPGQERSLVKTRQLGKSGNGGLLPNELVELVQDVQPLLGCFVLAQDCSTWLTPVAGAANGHTRGPASWPSMLAAPGPPLALCSWIHQNAFFDLRPGMRLVLGGALLDRLWSWNWLDTKDIKGNLALVVFLLGAPSPKPLGTEGSGPSHAGALLDDDLITICLAPLAQIDLVKTMLDKMVPP